MSTRTASAENVARVDFDSLFARTRHRAYNFAYRKTGNRDDAEDLTQEAYLRAFRSFDKYNQELPFENWFFRILSNLFVDSLRRKKYAISLDEPVSEVGDSGCFREIADVEADPESQLLKDLLDERLQCAIQRLPKDFRTAVLLCDVDGLTYEEIGRAMGSSIGTVRSRIHRGRKALRKLILAAPTDGQITAKRSGRT